MKPKPQNVLYRLSSPMLFKNTRVLHIFIILFWLLVWQVAATLIGASVLVVSPWQTLVRLTQLAGSQLFWSSIFMSMQRIMLGFFLALFFGVLLAIFSAKWKIVHLLFLPLVNVMNAIPIASFVIIALLAFSSRNLPVFVAFVTVAPIIFHNTHKGILSTEPLILEMAKVFRLSLWKRGFYIYFKSTAPFVLSAASVGIGFAWKSGIAAELIGIVQGTIGASLHQARVFLMTADVFAWTVTIVLLSYVMEKVFQKVFGALVRL